ncbi:tail fiber protein [Serratia ureilytica]|uniref:phage tail protein n=1 Tax=Serratia ureilytica TaxID=300181 RepID=UPI0018E7E6AB|nr:phage tail protein [Serratia ureilytica]MBJ2114408.1 tail fiber protein [Serratia ureilytica]
MTNKTSQNNTENMADTQTEMPGTTVLQSDIEAKPQALPQADELKVRFKSGSIPLQTDFADLIDLANVGCQAVGGAKGQTGPANGFILSSMGRLELKLKEDKGINVDKDGVGIKLKTISGLAMDNNGISVKPKTGGGIELKDSAGISIQAGNGISVDKDGVAVKVEGDKGLQINNNSISVKVGNGIAVNSSGVNIKLAKGDANNGGGGQGQDGVTLGSAGGLYLAPEGLSIDAGDGIQIDTQGVSIKLASNSGLSVDSQHGLKITEPAQVFQKGMVMMFAGTEAEMPEGWALCDGKEGRPDLTNRFVLGAASFNDIRSTNGKYVTGQAGSKEFITHTDMQEPTVAFTVDGHTLTIDEIPEHDHYDGIRFPEGGNILDVAEYRVEHVDSSVGLGKSYAKIETISANPSNYISLFSTSRIGGSKPHTHPTRASQEKHQHGVNIVPPYYTLAFIIKL